MGSVTTKFLATTTPYTRNVEHQNSGGARDAREPSRGFEGHRGSFAASKSLWM